MPELGRRLYAQNLVLRGRLTDGSWKVFLHECVRSMGMTPVGQPACYTYPDTHEGGGEGHTIVQPMVESYLVVDTWDAHDGAYLHIASCKRFDAFDLIEVCKGNGLVLEFAGEVETLRLDPPAHVNSPPPAFFSGDRLHNGMIVREVDHLNDYPECDPVNDP